MELLDCIWAGTCFKDDNHLRILHSLLQYNLEYDLGEVSLDTAFQSCATDLERIETMRKYFVWTPVPSIYFESMFIYCYTTFLKCMNFFENIFFFPGFKKSNDATTYFIQKAIESLKNENYKDALRGFNLGIMFGLNGEEEIGIAFLERAKFFIKIKRPELALRDIKEARQSNCPEALVKNIEDEMLAEKNYLISKYDGEDSVSSNKTDLKFFKLSSINSKLESAESFVQIEVTVDRGRRLVVSKNVNAGDYWLLKIA